MKKLTLLALIIAGLLFTTGCEEKTPQEKAKESVKNATKDVKDAVKDSAKKAEKAIKDSVEKTEKSLEDTSK